MKTKIVIEGTVGADKNAQKVLLALELVPQENKVQSWLIATTDLDIELRNNLLEVWNNGQLETMPDTALHTVTTLSASQSLLPQGFQTEQQDLVSRTQTEWIFIVLSTKLYKQYQEELNELKASIEQLSEYSKSKWDDMKGFWSKVQSQINEKNLFKDHSSLLKNQTNALFAQLKKLRTAKDAVFEQSAQKQYDALTTKLTSLESLANEGTQLDKTFNELKKLQQEFKSAQLTRTLRSQFWDKIDAVFKLVKNKRYPDSNSQDRLSRRIEGLLKAIEKMQRSIAKDEKELQIQSKRLNAPDLSQLENQLREVRAKLIRERIESKSGKLEDMNKTLVQLQKKQERNKKQASSESNNNKKVEEATATTINTAQQSETKTKSETLKTVQGVNNITSTTEEEE